MCEGPMTWSARSLDTKATANERHGAQINRASESWVVVPRGAIEVAPGRAELRGQEPVGFTLEIGSMSLSAPASPHSESRFTALLGLIGAVLLPLSRSYQVLLPKGNLLPAQPLRRSGGQLLRVSALATGDFDGDSIDDLVISELGTPGRASG